MIQIPNYRFRTLMSVDGYEKKSDATACLSRAGAKAIGKEKMAFRPWTVTIGEFLQYATSGHAFCNLFNFDCNQKYWVVTSTGKHYQTYPVYKKGRRAGAMKLNFKSDEFFYGAQVVYIDVDHTRFTNVLDYLQTLTFPPTGVYMSYSDGQPKGKEGVVSRRFRLVYVLDQVYGRDDLKRISSAITDQVIFDTAEPMADDCGERPCQYMNGVYGNNETYMSNFIYTVSDFPQSYDPPSPPPMMSGEDGETEIVFDEDLLREMETYPYAKFMHYHSWQYPYVYRKERPDDWIDGKYQMTDEGYLQLRHYREKVVDGQNRRRKLFKNACLRRLMYPDIDADTLLFNLYVDLCRYFDNSDGVITLDTLIRKVKKAMSMTPEQLRAYCDWEIRWCKENRPRFIIHRSFRGLKGMASSIAKKIRWAEIDRAYDKSLSLKENLETNLTDLDISASTLYRYCKENYIDTDPRPKMTAREKREEKRLEKTRNIERFKDLYDPDLSLRKNLDRLEDAGLKMSMGRLLDWIKKYYIPARTDIEQNPFTGPFNWNPPKMQLWGWPDEDDTYDVPVSDWDREDTFTSSFFQVPHFEFPPF